MPFVRHLTLLSPHVVIIWCLKTLSIFMSRIFDFLLRISASITIICSGGCSESGPSKFGWVLSTCHLQFTTQIALRSLLVVQAYTASPLNVDGSVKLFFPSTLVFKRILSLAEKSFFHMVFIILPNSGSLLNRCSLLRMMTMLIEALQYWLDFLENRSLFSEIPLGSSWRKSPANTI